MIDYYLILGFISMMLGIYMDDIVLRSQPDIYWNKSITAITGFFIIGGILLILLSV
jgi:hypothetical protein